MNFRTTLDQIEIQNLTYQIDYRSKVGLMGSCFVENIGEKLSYYKFNHFVNPYGILFHPKAIEKALSDIAQQQHYIPADLVFENERWHSLHHHSDFSNTDASLVLANINDTIKSTSKSLRETSHLIITLGTAWVYHHIQTDQLVANCHKIPQKNFIKRILSVAEIVASLEHTIQLARALNPDIQIILTLSPVRHLKDGMLANSRSKAHLLTAIHQVVADSKASYFPSYEIVLDDLRDYRFYASDMLHPNQTAVDYVWEIFKNKWISSQSDSIMDQVDQIQKGLKHKAFNPDSKQHKKFIDQLEQQKKALLKLHTIQF